MTLIGQTTKDGKIIKDELCHCGHSVTEHEGEGPRSGHGACQQCECFRYTWKCFVYSDDKNTNKEKS